jgi:hypothetical protein
MATRTQPGRVDDLPLPVVNAAQGIGSILERMVARTSETIAALRSAVAGFPTPSAINAGTSKPGDAGAPAIVGVTDAQAERTSRLSRHSGSARDAQSDWPA